MFLSPFFKISIQICFFMIEFYRNDQLMHVFGNLIPRVKTVSISVVPLLALFRWLFFSKDIFLAYGFGKPIHVYVHGIGSLAS